MFIIKENQRKMKLDFVKNRPFFIAVCIFLATVLVLLAIWKQGSSLKEGMIVMDFTTPSNPEAGSNLTDMDLQGYNSALIPFEKKFENAEKAKSAIQKYTESFKYDPSGNTTEINMEAISSNGLDGFIGHLNKTGQSFQNFAEALTQMKKNAINEATQKQQGLTVLSV